MGKNFGGFGGFGGGNMQAMMRQAQKMQQDALKAKEELDNTIFEGTASGGLVKVEISGACEMQSVKIDPSVVDPEDVEMIEDFPIPYPSGETGWDLIKSGVTPTGVTLSSDNKVYIKNINSLNSYLFDDDFGLCPLTPIILHYYIPDNLITRSNTFYKGEIYLGNTCASQKYISFPGQTINYNNKKLEETDSKTRGIHVIGTTTTNKIGGNKIEFLVKWDGKSTVKIRKAGNSSESTIKKLDIELSKLI